MDCLVPVEMIKSGLSDYELQNIFQQGETPSAINPG